MPLFEVAGSKLVRHRPEKFAELKMYERADLQRLLREDITAIDPEVLVISEEFGHWEDARRRIDLLGIDKEARLVVIELKRTDDGGHMELQAIRYAAMVSTMAFNDVLNAFEAHRMKHSGPDPGIEPEEELRNWLEQRETDEEPEIASDVRIILVSADFDVEITTAVIWLNKFEGMDIRCVRLQPYSIDGKVVLDIQQVLPLPEAADYQVKVRRKEAAIERARTDNRDFTRYSIVVGDNIGPDLNKRHAVLAMIKALHEQGVSLHAVKDLLPSARMLSIRGEYTPDDADAAFLKEFPKFRGRRHFVRDVMTDRGETFVVSNQWGTNTEPILMKLQNAFPESKVSFRRQSDVQ